MLDFISKEPILKGWSNDRKYCVTDANGIKYLLRITPKEFIAGRERLFQLQKEAAKLGIPMCMPVAFENCEEGVCSLHTWIEGEDAETEIPKLSDEAQYAYGLEAGRILRSIHTIPAPVDQPDWGSRFNSKIDRKLQMYARCPIQFDGARFLIDYIVKNRYLLKNRPQCFQHGDYHVGNMMISGGNLVIIDFDRYDFGDPWEEFNRIVWCAQVSPRFASGMIRGYFDGEVPTLFWRLLALYISSNTLSSIPWAIPFGDEEVKTMVDQTRDVLSWYENMKRVVPSWYISK